MMLYSCSQHLVIPNILSNFLLLAQVACDYNHNFTIKGLFSLTFSVRHRCTILSSLKFLFAYWYIEVQISVV
ncbi:hypothetical protein ASPFODRAFT_678307 [Aspergillus luchuensis CBS 106.47]|uniref:Uncharacterized protein n=1 Tax=Aspergillus luchuensis (strain CBS 106.47) TaxID=1137211 RepID=A0A1M3TCI7_ASPLC|nr:hypothetical protein ASPFODRAFT_678307 [Aspergillus luchuensis CBS 106.47]